MEQHETTRETQWGGRWRNSGEQGGAAPGRKVEQPRGARWSSPREQGGGTPGRKVEQPQGGRWRNSGEQGGGTQGCKVEANGSIMKQPVKHSGATFVKLYVSWRIVRALRRWPTKGHEARG